MGIDIKTPVDDIKLKAEDDFVAFAQLIGLKLSTNPTRSHIVSFMNELVTAISAELTSDDLSKIQSKVSFQFNQKLKESQNKQKKPAKKGPKLRTDGSPKTFARNVGFDMYEDQEAGGTEDYGGYNEVDFM